MISETLSPHRGGFAPWLAVLAVALGAFATVTSEFLPVGLLPQIAADLHVATGTAGLMLTFPGVIAAVSAPAILLIARKMDRARLLQALALLLLASNVLCMLASDFSLILAGRAVFGIALGGFWTVALGSSTRLVSARHGPRALSIVLAGISCATILGVPLGSLVGHVAGWRAGFGAAATLAVLAVLSQSAALPRIPAGDPVSPTAFARLLRLPALRTVLLLVLLLFAANLAAFTYLAPFLIERTGVGAAWIPSVLLMFGGAGMLANLLVPQPLHRSPKLVVVVLAVLMAASFAFLPLVGSATWPVLLLLLAWAIPFGAVPLCLSHLNQLAAGDAPEAAAALFVCAAQTSIAIGSAVGAAVVNGYGLSAQLVLAAALSSAAAVAASRRLAPDGRPLPRSGERATIA